MDNIEYTLGQLTADMAEVKSDVKDLKKIVNDLNLWRVKVITISGVVGGIGGFVINLIVKYL